MYRDRPNLMIGFHGCDESVRNDLVNKPDNVKSSKEAFDWLGHGFYIWENNYTRALQWAKDKNKRGVLNHPSVVGVVYQLNNCLDFTDSEYINLLGSYFELMKQDFKLSERDLPKNKNLPKDKNHDLILRELDCAVIQYLHQKVDEEINDQNTENGFSLLKRFDSVRGIFTEGGPAFEGAGIQSKNHIQICIRNLNCIKGFFIPRKDVTF
jgi:hypothetical protein